MGTAASVSTLFTVVGIPNAPACAGKGGFAQGSARFPMSEFMRPVSSPAMYAPAPAWIVTSHDHDEPRIPSPARPLSYASTTAAFSTCVSSKNSPRT